MLPASQLTDATDLGINGAQAGAVALTPDHALVVGGRNLAAPLHQRAVGVNERDGGTLYNTQLLFDADVSALGSGRTAIRRKCDTCSRSLMGQAVIASGDE